ncbi:hypothetical protein PTUN_a2130 [Pseudoalteromonas tunicata]|nr:hypothetical protein PTUN_a2130 [Pseudoalteromonas tunicata]
MRPSRLLTDSCLFIFMPAFPRVLAKFIVLFLGEWPEY